jgi:hypothetical protein
MGPYAAGRMSPRTRTILAWTLLFVGALVVFVGSLTVWVKRQALDTDAWADTSAQLLEDDDVRQALSVYIVDQLYANLDPESTLQEELPPNLQGLAGPISGALREPAQRAVDKFLQRPRVQALWEDVNRAAQQTLLRILEDETREGVSTAGGTVTLDLRTFVVNVGEELGFGEQLDARLPADAGQVTILESDQLEAAQTGLKMIKVLSWLIIVIALAAFAGAVWLARGRREMLRDVGISLLLVGILLLVVRRVVGSYIVDALASGVSVRDAVGSAWIIGTSLLAQVAWALIVYGLVILVGTWLAGPTRPARGVQEAIGPTLHDRPGLSWAVLAGVFLLLVLWAPVPALRNWIGVLLLGALAALGFEAFRGVVAAEAGPGEPRPVDGPPPASTA